MMRLTTALGFAAAIAVLASAPVASAETTGAVVPPENSAAAQYTEAVPTAGGEKQSGGGKGGHRSPEQVLGAHNAHKLESRGKSGREVAEVVVATAPAASGAKAPEGGSAARPESAGNGGAGNSGHGAPSQGGESPGSASPKTKEPARGELPDGSSGLGETLAAATGSSSSGELGALLPLAIAAAIVWALVFFWRQRRQAG